jgi:pyridoxamine 5'-phosphate oxidase
MTSVTQTPESSHIEGSDPIAQFKIWLEEAEKTEPSLATAMTLATATSAGVPSARMVLLKDVDDQGFTFYTNLESRKALELRENPTAALCFHWKASKRQVRIEGAVQTVDDGEADAYFESRPRGAQIGAWASKQSAPLKGRFELERQVAMFTAKFHIGSVPRPDFWSGYRVVPARIEFWQEQAFRLHDRVVFERQDNQWVSKKLYP